MRPPLVFPFGALLLALGFTAPAAAQNSVRVSVGAMQGPAVRHVASSAEAAQLGLERPITIKLGNVPLESALEEIAKRASLTLGYPPDLLPEGRRVSLHLEARPAREALADVLRQTGLAVRVLPGGQVTLVRQTDPGPVGNRVQTGTLVGRVTDAASGAALAGANVRLPGTRRGAQTDADGRYRVEQVPAGTYTIVASRIGYAEQSQQATVVAEQTATVDFALTLSAVPLDQLVVVGTLMPTEVRALPAPVSVITAEEIQRRNLPQIDRIFQGMVPGVVSKISAPGGISSVVMVRGASSLATGISSIKTYIDGVPVASPTFLSGIDPNSIERIEVIRGPQAATLYGPEALNGVMLIFTRRGKPGGRPELRAKVAAGAIQSNYASGLTPQHDHSVGVSGGTEAFGYALDASYRATGEWVSEYASYTPGFSGSVRVHQGPISVDLSTRFARTSYHIPANPILRDLGYAPWMGPQNERLDLQHQTHGVRVTYAPLPYWEHQLSVGQDFMDYDGQRTAPRLRTPADTLLTVDSSKRGRVSLAYNSGLRANLGRGISSMLTLGMDYYRLDGSQFYQANTTRTRGSLDGTTLYTVRDVTSNTGLFSQLQLGFSDDLFLTAGLRADRNANFGSDFGAALSPRVGAAYTLPIRGVTIKSRASYGEAIRPPVVGQSTGSSTAAVRILPNPQLAPERQRGWDAGVDVYGGAHTRIGLTRYDQQVVNLIESVLVDATATPRTQQSQNVGRIANRGWEFEARTGIGAMRLSGTYSLMTSRIEALSPTYTGSQQVGEQLVGVPKRSGGLEVGLSLGQRTDVAANLSYRSGWTDLDVLALYGWAYGGTPYRGSLRAYYVGYEPVTKVGLNASHVLTPRLTSFLQIENLMNSSRPELVNGSPIPGRTLMLGARLVH
jgi:outer membrane receptor protein involved in Fe transport